MEMINSERYPAEKHTIYTSDGYILTVYRIPSLNKPFNNPKVMLFMHGEMNAKWIIQTICWNWIRVFDSFFSFWRSDG